MRSMLPWPTATSELSSVSTIAVTCVCQYRYKPPKYNDMEELERKYWKNVTFNQPLYGADIQGKWEM